MGTAAYPGRIGSAFKTWASFVKFAHTVFALPFALSGLLTASASTGARWSWWVLGWVLLAMVGARSFAMGINRIVDRRIDALNPRTAVRELPAGRMSLRQAWAFTLVMAAAYFAACAMLGRVVLALSPIPVALMALYPWTKRFTPLCHLVLGCCLGLAPVGAWVALRAGSTGAPAGPLRNGLQWGALAEVAPWLLGGAVALWVAGFDVIYALQDEEFDRAQELHSIPAALGARRALLVSRFMHAASALLFFGFAAALSGAKLFAPLAWAAAAAMACGMIWQHRLVKADNFSRVNMAFFTVNGVVALFFGGLTAVAVLLG